MPDSAAGGLATLFAGAALSSSAAAFQTFQQVLSSWTGGDGGAISANGNGLANALTAFNQGQLVTSSDGSLIGGATLGDGNTIGNIRDLGSAAILLSTDADHNIFLSDAYPEWFAEPGCTKNTRDKRLERGRTDIRVLLQSLIDRKDLDS